MEKLEKSGLETILDYNTGKYYHFDHRSGQALRCNVKGDPIPKFLHNLSGFADTAERKRRGCMPDVEVLGVSPNLPYLQLPAKYCGYASCPRPGLNMSASVADAYKLPQYLQPQAVAVGRVSTKVVKKEVKRDEWNPECPTFMATLGSQFDDAQKMSVFLPEQDKIKTRIDLDAVTARNKQVVLGMKGTLDVALEKLRAQRTKTSGRFGRRAPPYNALEIRKVEDIHHEAVNPTKVARDEAARLVDRSKVEQRRRDRYLQFFVEKEEQEARVMRSEQALAKTSE